MSLINISSGLSMDSVLGVLVTSRRKVVIASHRNRAGYLVMGNRGRNLVDLEKLALALLPSIEDMKQPPPTIELSRLRSFDLFGALVDAPHWVILAEGLSGGRFVDASGDPAILLRDVKGLIENIDGPLCVDH